MRTTTRRMQLTVERTETLLFRPAHRSVSCAFCGRDARMLSPDAVAAISGISLRTICRLVEANAVHFVENDDGRLLVCSESLAQLEK